MSRYNPDIFGLSKVRLDNLGEHKLLTGPKLLYLGFKINTKYIYMPKDYFFQMLP